MKAANTNIKITPITIKRLLANAKDANAGIVNNQDDASHTINKTTATTIVRMSFSII